MKQSHQHRFTTDATTASVIVNKVNDLNVLTIRLRNTPRSISESTLVEALSPASLNLPVEFQPLVIERIAVVVRYMQNMEVLHSLAYLWLNAITSEQVHMKSAMFVLNNIAGHPFVSDETCIELLDAPFPELRETIRTNIVVPNRIRVLAAL